MYGAVRNTRQLGSCKIMRKTHWKNQFSGQPGTTLSMDYRHFYTLDCHQKAIVSLKIFLIVTQALVQLLIIPLLELQWLDQYAWVCVADGINRNYCSSDGDADHLALDQVVVVYMFYASIVCATLLSLVICWLPQYVNEDDQDNNQNERAYYNLWIFYCQWQSIYSITQYNFLYINIL